jgi:ketosteroid isomerase-like protein
MTTTHFATAEDAQKAFYQAIERANLAQMMAIWSEDEDIVCIHPGGARNAGIVEVRESWRQIFSQGPQLKFSLVADKIYPGRMLSIHNVYEQITHIAGAHPPASVIATNIFVLSSDGWQMLMHHASPIPEERLQGPSSPSVLH